MAQPDLSDWWNSPLGTLLREQEQRVVAEALEDVFGLQLLQIGAWGKAGEFFKAARTQRQTVIASDIPSVNGSGSRVLSRPTALAVASDSVDAVILPHTLEFEDDPYAVLREVSRVLSGEGKLVVLGFSPLGPWALRHRLSHDSFPPGLERLISPRRLKEWLKVLSFEVTTLNRYLFQLPSPSRKEHRWLVPAAAYLLKAQKRVYTLTPIRPKWREKRPIVGGLVEPSTRLIHD
jgi:SAM-dependent methyltransferase